MSSPPLSVKLRALEPLVSAGKKVSELPGDEANGAPGRATGGLGGRLPILGQSEAPPERKDAARNRARILQAARKLLETRPIGEICMDEVARTAGVGKGTLYRRFADRASLCRALLHEEATRLQDHVLSGMGLGLEAPWLDRLDRLLSALFDFVADNCQLLSEAQAFERGPSRFDHPAHAWQRETVARYLGYGMAAKEIAPVDAEVTAELILAGLDPDLIQSHLSRGIPRERLGASFRRFWRTGVIGAELRAIPGD